MVHKFLEDLHQYYFTKRRGCRKSSTSYYIYLMKNGKLYTNCKINFCEIEVGCSIIAIRQHILGSSKCNPFITVEKHYQKLRYRKMRTEITRAGTKDFVSPHIGIHKYVIISHRSEDFLGQQPVLRKRCYIFMHILFYA